ncbi:uncharacterized protein LOC135400481 [Ornithodoros turicata]|uniref:uncharacterized protein LOC135400481 n=1 Tax=Ornithodoros turicata TaxID=34597 RepID=UPI0031388370
MLVTVFVEMFYAQELLRKRDGRLGLVWAAACCPNSITLKEILEADIKTLTITVTHLVQGSGELQWYRLSLRLSSNLLCGLCWLYKAKAERCLDAFKSAVRPKSGPVDVLFTSTRVSKRSLPTKHDIEPDEEEDMGRQAITNNWSWMVATSPVRVGDVREDHITVDRAQVTMLEPSLPVQEAAVEFEDVTTPMDLEVELERVTLQKSPPLEMIRDVSVLDSRRQGSLLSPVRMSRFQL